MALVPFPPQVLGLITPISPQIHLRGLDPAVQVSIFGSQSGLLSNDPYTGPSDAWLPLNKKPIFGEIITASQRAIAGGSDSGVSKAGGVKVEAVPSPLPCPNFLRRIQNCTSSIDLDGLIPGTDLTVTVRNNPIVHTTVLQTTENFVLDPQVQFGPHDIFLAWQTNPLDQSNPPPCVAGSLPVLDLQLAPQTSGPFPNPGLVACTDFGTFGGLVEGADLTIANEGQNFISRDVADGREVFSLPPGVTWKAGSVSAQEAFPKCNLKYPAWSGTVAAGPAPTPPTIPSPICSFVDSLRIDGLNPGKSTVTVQRLVAGHPELTLTRHQQTTDTSWDCPLPDAWSLTDPNGAVSFKAQQSTDCGTSDWSAVATVSPNLAHLNQPGLVEPLYECARFLHVQAATPGCEMYAVSNMGGQLSNPLIVDTAEFFIHTDRLYRPLIANEVITLHQYGCGDDLDSLQATVRPTATGGAPIPAPTIINLPIYQEDVGLTIDGVLPGAIVGVLFDNEQYEYGPNLLLPRVEAVATKIQYTLPATPSFAHQLSPYQYICGNHSNPTTNVVTVTRPNIKILASPLSIVKGSPTDIHFDLIDPNPAKNLLNYWAWNPIKCDGITIVGSQSITFRIPASDTRTFVIASVAAGPYNEAASLTIPINKPPPPPPQPTTFKLQLAGVGAYMSLTNPANGAQVIVQFTKITWKVSPSWAAAQTVAVSANPNVPTQQLRTSVNIPLWKSGANTIAITGTAEFSLNDTPGFSVELTLLAPYAKSDGSQTTCISWLLSFDYADAFGDINWACGCKQTCADGKDCLIQESTSC